MPQPDRRGRKFRNDAAWAVAEFLSRKIECPLPRLVKQNDQFSSRKQTTVIHHMIVTQKAVMNEQPTPAEIANALDVALQALGGTGGTFDRVEWLRDRLRSGAVIVHPDDDVDVEPLEWPNNYLRQQAYDLAVERTRRAIFGGSHE